MWAPYFHSTHLQGGNVNQSLTFSGCYSENQENVDFHFHLDSHNKHKNGKALL